MDWKQLAQQTPPQRQPGRFERIRNGDRDHINGYDDGEWMASERPAGYFAATSERDEETREVEHYKQLEGTNIY